MKKGFIAGFLGAIILIAVMYLLQLAQLSGEPGFVGIGKTVLGSGLAPALLNILSAGGFALAGGVWGLIFAVVVRNPNLVKGMLFGLAPTLFLWLVIAPLTGKPIFNGFALPGILLPILFNVIIWGGFVGWFLSRKN
jgi:hypothetical protein